MKNTFINNYRRNVKENTIIDGTKDLYYLNQPHDKGFISPESNYSEGEIEKRSIRLKTNSGSRSGCISRASSTKR